MSAKPRVRATMTLSFYGPARFGMGHRTNGGHRAKKGESVSVAESLTAFSQMLERLHESGAMPGDKVIVTMEAKP